MDRKQQHLTQSQTVIPLGNKSYTLQEANALAIREHSHGNFQAALDIYNLILAKAPEYAEAYSNRGAILHEMQRYDEALASCDKAITLAPGYAAAHANRGNALRRLGQYDNALASYDKAIALKPDYIDAHTSRGSISSHMKKYDEALASYDKAIALKPDFAEAYYHKGTILVSKGDMAEAERMFHRALALKPDYPRALFGLTRICKYKDADTENIRMLLDKPSTSREDKEFLYFSLGKIYDDNGLYDEAFESYRQANKILNAQVSYNPHYVTKLTSQIIEVFSKDFLAQNFSFASDSKSPIFIVGMPRSGTTLMASILSNHPSIATAGELITISEFATHLPELSGNGISYPQAVRQLPPALVSRLIHDYMTRLRRDAGSDIPYVIDKYPLNCTHLGFISMLFPKATIIHCTRHPLDTCLSNYVQYFALDYDYAFDLRNIGHFYREYERLMEHWRKVLPTQMIEISYEDMIANTESIARKALDSLGLEWDKRCLSPHTNPYAVETASNWQVRQPIYKQSVERWRHYGKHLQPLKEMLQNSASGDIPETS